jgi:hypothetical protein
MKERTDIGQLDFSGNELKVDATIDDPPKVRGGRPTPGALFVLSGDLLIPDPTEDDPHHVRRVEKAFVKLETDEFGGGQVEIHALKPATEGDENTVRLLTLNTRELVVYVPIVALAGITNRMPDGPVPPPLPPPIPDPPDTGETHGIAAGDFVGIVNVYGFPSDQQDEWARGRITSWSVIIARMDERDGYRRFPKRDDAPPPVVNTPDATARRGQLDAINREFEPWGLAIDSDAYNSYLAGNFRGKTPAAYLKEIHDDVVRRNDGAHDPNAHPIGAPY